MRVLKDRVAVVTGAASGIGLAVAEHLAGQGCHLALVDNQDEGLRRAAERLSMIGRRVSAHCVDVSDKVQIQALPMEVLAHHRQAHILVNNAGVSLAGPFETYTLDDLEWIMGVNLWGVVYGCSVFLPYLRQREEGHIVNVSSDFGLLGFPTKSAYCTTKFAIRGFSEALRAELHGSQIGVTCVYPGAVDTELIRSARTRDPAKRDLEARFVADRGMPVNVVARRIVRAIERNQGRVLIGSDTYLIDSLTRLFPGLVNELVARFYQRLPFV